jgi:hypothetical protein
MADIKIDRTDALYLYGALKFYLHSKDGVLDTPTTKDLTALLAKLDAATK